MPPEQNPRLPVTVVSSATGVWGTERSIFILAPHLRDLGVDLTIACPDGEFTTAARDFGLPTVTLELPPRGGERQSRVGGLLRDARGVPAGVRRVMAATRGAAVVHSNNLLMHPDAVLAGRLTGRPTVLELHDIVDPGLPVAAQSAVIALSSATVSVSSAATARVRQPGLRKVQLLTQAVDLDTFYPGPPDPAWRAKVEAPVVVGMVGRIDTDKGIDVLIRAAAKLSPEVGVIVVGKPSQDAGGHLAELLALGEQLLGPRFHYGGVIDLGEVPDLLRSLDVLVNASTDEPFGMSMMEGVACGAAAICTDSGGVTDYIRDGETGLVTPARDVDALAAALRRLIDDAALRERLTGNALELARREHSGRTRAERLLAVYRSVLRGRGSRSGRV